MEPIYEQIVAQIKAEVIEGTLTAGDLPYRKLCGRLLQIGAHRKIREQQAGKHNGKLQDRAQNILQPTRAVENVPAVEQQRQHGYRGQRHATGKKRDHEKLQRARQNEQAAYRI